MKHSDIRRSYRTGMNIDDIWLEEVLDEVIWYNKVHNSLTSGFILHVLSCWLLFMEDITCWSSPKLFWSETFLSLCSSTSQLCRFTTPVPHLAVYSGISDFPSANASPSLPFLAQTPVCPSPISVALDSTSASDRRVEASEGEGEGNPAAPATVGGNASKSRVALSLRRLLRRGCTPTTMFASLSPKCHSAAGTSSRIQPISPDQPSQAPPRRIAKWVKTKSRNWTLSDDQSCVSPRSLCTVFSRLKLIFLQSAVSTP